MNEIIFFTIHCPHCKILQRLLDTKHIPYSIVDDKEEVLHIADANHIMQAPFAQINGEYYNTKQLQNWIKEQ